MIVILATLTAGSAVAAWAARIERRSAEQHADRLAARIAGHPALGLPVGSGRVIEGEILVRMAPGVAPQSGKTVTASVTDVPARHALSAGSCPGHLVAHEDGQITCHRGRDDCWPGIGPNYTHTRRPERCGEQSHGCGSCQSAGWAA